MIKLDIFIVSPLITELMLKGYVEIIRRRRLFFFSREYCIITAEGLVALEQARSLFENIVELIRERAVETIDNIAADSPLLKLTVMSAKAAYKTVKVLMWESEEDIKLSSLCARLTNSICWKQIFSFFLISMREKRHIDAMSADKQESLYSYRRLQLHMQYEESIYTTVLLSELISHHNNNNSRTYP